MFLDFILYDQLVGRLDDPQGGCKEERHPLRYCQEVRDEFPEHDQEYNEARAQDVGLFFGIKAGQPVHRVSCVALQGANTASSLLMASVRTTAAIINTNIPANISGSR